MEKKFLENKHFDNIVSQEGAESLAQLGIVVPPAITLPDAVDISTLTTTSLATAIVTAASDHVTTSSSNVETSVSTTSNQETSSSVATSSSELATIATETLETSSVVTRVIRSVATEKTSYTTVISGSDVTTTEQNDVTEQRDVTAAENDVKDKNGDSAEQTETTYEQ